MHKFNKNRCYTVAVLESMLTDENMNVRLSKQ